MSYTSNVNSLHHCGMALKLFISLYQKVTMTSSQSWK